MTEPNCPNCYSKDLSAPDEVKGVYCQDCGSYILLPDIDWRITWNELMIHTTRGFQCLTVKSVIKRLLDIMRTATNTALNVRKRIAIFKYTLDIS